MSDTIPLKNNTINRISFTGLFLWLLVAIFYGLDYLQHTLPSVLILPISHSLNVDYVVIGTLMNIYFPIYALSQIPAGFVIDRFGLRRALTLASLLMSVGLLCMTVPALTLITLGRALIAIGSAFAFIGGLKAAALYLPSKWFSLMTGVLQSIGVIGGLLGQVLLNYLIETFSWHSAVYFLSIFGVVWAAVLFIGLQIKPRHANEEKKHFKLAEKTAHLRDYLVIFKDVKLWLMALYAALIVGAILSTFGETYSIIIIEKLKHLSSSQAALINSLIFIGIGAGAPLHGLIANRWRSASQWMFVAAVITLCLFYTISLLLYGLNKAWILGLAYFFLGFFISSMLLTFTLAKRQYAEKYHGVVFAFINMMIGLGGFFVPLIFGYLIHFFSHLTQGAENLVYAVFVLNIPVLIATFIAFWLNNHCHTQALQLEGEKTVKPSFIHGSLDRYLLSLAVPATISILVNISFIAVDTYFLSLLGIKALVAISFIFPMVAFFQMVANGWGIATTSIISRLIGADDSHAASTYVAVSLLSAGVFYLIVAVIGPFVTAPFFRFIGAEADIIPYIQAFMNIWYVGLVLILISFIGSNVMRANNLAKQSAWINIVSALLNLALSPLLIFVFKLGMAGSALAGVLARVVTSGVAMIYLVRLAVPTFAVSIRAAIADYLPKAKYFFSIAVPAILTNAIGPIASFWMLYLLAGMSQQAVAAYGIASRIELLAVIPLLGLSASVGPIIGQNLGAKQYERSFSTLLKSYKVSIIWGVLVALALYFLGYRLALIFTRDSHIADIAALYLAILPLSYASWGIIMMTCANFNSVGKPVRSTLLTFTRMGFIFIPLSFILGHYFGYLGVFLSLAISTLVTSLVASLMAVWYWRSLDGQA